MTSYTILNDFLSLLFPRSCLTCGVILVHSENYLCLHCVSDLPRHLSGNSNLDLSIDVLGGRINVMHEAAFLEFTENNKGQHIIHSLKYQNKRQLGIEFGNIIGEILIQKIPEINFDAVIPVPLHQKKIAKRGYNQSEMLARGIADKLNTMMIKDLLVKIEETKSQTKKSRYDRWKNVASVFTITKGSYLKFKHVLLVDDVITTGATLESCAKCLQEKYKCDVSVIALAYTS